MSVAAALFAVCSGSTLSSQMFRSVLTIAERACSTFAAEPSDLVQEFYSRLLDGSSPMRTSQSLRQVLLACQSQHPQAEARARGFVYRALRYMCLDLSRRQSIRSRTHEEMRYHAESLSGCSPEVYLALEEELLRPQKSARKALDIVLQRRRLQDRAALELSWTEALQLLEGLTPDEILGALTAQNRKQARDRFYTGQKRLRQSLLTAHLLPGADLTGEEIIEIQRFCCRLRRG